MANTSVHIAWLNLNLSIDPINIDYLSVDLGSGADDVQLAEMSSADLTQIQLDLGGQGGSNDSSQTCVEAPTLCQPVFRRSFEVGSIVGNFDSFAGLTTDAGQRAQVFIQTTQAADSTQPEIRQIYHNGAAGAFTLTLAARDEHQTVYLDSDAGSAFTLRFRSETTAEISSTATAADVQAALEALAAIGSGNVFVTGSGTASEPWDIRFSGPIGGSNPVGRADVDQLTTLSDGVMIDTVVSGSSQPVTTTPLSFDASAADVRSALRSLTGSDHSVTGSGSQADPWVVTFIDSDPQDATRTFWEVAAPPELNASVTGMLDLDQFAGLERSDGSEATVTIQTTQKADSSSQKNEIRSVWHDGSRGAFSIILANLVATIDHNADAGTFTVQFNGHTTADQPFDSSASQLQAALETLPGIGAGNVTVTRTQSSSSLQWRIEFQGDLAGQAVPEINADFSNLSLADGTVSGAVNTAAVGGDLETGLIEHDASPDRVAAVLGQAARATFHVTGTGTMADPWVIEYLNSADLTVPAWSADTSNTSGFGAYELVDSSGNTAQIDVNLTSPSDQDALFEVSHDGISGGFALTYNDQTTRILDYGVAAEDLAAALNALVANNINVTVTGDGSAADPWVVSFAGSAGTTVDLSASAQGVDLPAGSPATLVNTVTTEGDDGARNEVQTITPTGTGADFTLSFRGESTPPLAHDVSAVQLQAALQGLSTIGSGNVQVTDGTSGGWNVEFVAVMARQHVAEITEVVAGGGSPSVIIFHHLLRVLTETRSSGFTTTRLVGPSSFALAASRPARLNSTPRPMRFSPRWSPFPASARATFRSAARGQ